MGAPKKTGAIVGVTAAAVIAASAFLNGTSSDQIPTADLTTSGAILTEQAPVTSTADIVTENYDSSVEEAEVVITIPATEEEVIIDSPETEAVNTTSLPVTEAEATTTTITTTTTTTTTATTTITTTTTATTTIATTTTTATLPATEPVTITTPAETKAPVTESTTKVGSADVSTETISIVSFNNQLRRNEDATITIKGLPYTEYRIKVYYSTTASKAKGLENKTSNSDGIVSWTWHVGGKTNLSNNLRIEISGGGDKITIPFSVYD